MACFEPTIDYVVTKIPRWTFEKFPEADETLTTQMKSVGEAMSIGRTFKESLQKGIRSMEVKRFGFGLDANDKWLNAKRGKVNADGSKVEWPIEKTKLRRKLTQPSQGRFYYIRYAFKMGWSIDDVYELTHIDPWFLDQFKQLVDFEDTLCSYDSLGAVPRDVLFTAKQYGYSDAQLANLYLGRIASETILQVRARRKELGITPVFKLVDTCAAEFEAATPYYYSTYESPYTVNGEPTYDNEVRVSDNPKVMILGGGPNRIGQGIEFDYCCVQAAFASRELEYEAVMVNSNPETVSTDYDTSDLLFFEPLTLEDVLNIYDKLNERDGVKGVIVQYGGQTPLNLAHGLVEAGVRLLGTDVDSIDLAEDRERFKQLCSDLDVRQPANGIAYNVDQAIEIANKISYPVLVRPSFVLGGRAMETVFDDDQLRHYMAIALGASDLDDQPILIDKFLSEAVECDVDVICDATPGASGEVGPAEDASALVAGVMEHIEEAGIHSGDSACAIPPHSLPDEVVAEIKDKSRALARALRVSGLMNVQWAVRRSDGGHEVFVIEVNPRASRTVPFVSKATGRPWARLAAKVMAGHSLADLGVDDEIVPEHTSVKESVFPFSKFPGVDVILGPEMRSTGEVMGIDPGFPIAFAKAQMAAGNHLPTSGTVFLSVRDSDKPAARACATRLLDMGFVLKVTSGMYRHLEESGVDLAHVERLNKISEGRPNAADLIKNHELDLIINTPTRKGINTDEGMLRALAVRFAVPMVTTVTGAAAAVQAIDALRADTWTVRALQDYTGAAARPIGQPVR